MFKKRFEVLDTEKVMDTENSGYVIIKDYIIKDKKSRITPISK
jgi:hypothetical protein